MLVAGLAQPCLGIPESGDYGIYVGSNSRRPGDVAEHAEPYVCIACIDTKIGGNHHNMIRPAVNFALTQAAACSRCKCVLISVDCATWSAAFFLPQADGSPGPPLRDGYNISGIAGPDGTLSRKVREANVMTKAGAGIAAAGMSHEDCRVIAETPACRGDGCGGLVTPAAKVDALVDAERHVYMFDDPDWRRLILEKGATVTVCDQCEWGASGEKATALLACGNSSADVKMTFAKRCSHGKGAHTVLRGVNASGSYRTSGTEAYESGFCADLVACLIPAAGAAPAELACVAGVLHGKRTPDSAITSDFVHNTFNHGETRVLKHLCDALSDISKKYAQVLEDKPCDACLRAEAPRIGPTGHLPDEEGLWFLDSYHTQIPGLWKGERVVIGFTNAKSRLFRSWIATRKSQAPEAYEKCIAYCKSKGIRFTWVHTDNALELKGTKIVEIAKKHGFRITTNCVNASRQNLQEPMWRAMGSYVRKTLEQALMPLCFWPWFWRDCEEALSLKPSRSPPHECALGRALGHKPKGAHRRPPGCLAYVTIAKRLPSGTLANKQSIQAVRGLNLGYVGNETGSFGQLGIEICQPGYAIYIGSDEVGCGAQYAGTIHVCSDVRFVPAVFPGLKRSAGGGWCIPLERIPFINRFIEPAEPKSGPAQQLDSSAEAVHSESDQGTSEHDQPPPAVPPPPSGLIDISTDDQLGETGSNDYDYLRFEMQRGFPPEGSDEPAVDGEDPIAKSTTAEKTTSAETPIATRTEQSITLIPREHWPHETCDEHNGEGWEVTVSENRGRWSKCRFINAKTADGRRYADEWRPTDQLIKKNISSSDATGTGSGPARRPIAPDDPVPFHPSPVGDGQTFGPAPGETKDPSPNFNTLPPHPAADPL